MSRLTFSTQISSMIQWSILCLILIMCLHPQWISGNPIDDFSEEDFDYSKRSISDNVHGVRRDVWSILFGYDNAASRHQLNHHGSSIGRVRIIPFDKRTIPIELQKALYAHGIVGRRR